MPIADVGEWYASRAKEAKALSVRLEALRLKLGLSRTVEVSPQHQDEQMAQYGRLQLRLEAARNVGD